MLTIEQVMGATHGKLLQPGRRRQINHITIDSRKIRRGSLFIAVKGARLDGHDFIGQAVSSGAKFLVVSTKHEAPADVAVILVEDTTKALGLIAGIFRRQFRIPVIAITGSSGKTTTKEMIASVLSGRYKVLKNIKTENNHFGVPLTLLRLTKAHQAAVIEFGTNQPGDIAWLARITEPDIGVFTNIGEAHLEGLKSQAGIFREKSSMIGYLRSKGKIIINEDDSHLRRLHTNNKGRQVITYSIKARAKFKAVHIKLEKSVLQFTVQNKEYALSSFAVHNVYNALAAICCGSLLGVPYVQMAKKLRAFKFPDGRFAVKNAGPIRLIDDTYNANPSSMRCAVEALSQSTGATRRVVVCADMLELGDRSDELHEKLGNWMASQNIDHVFSYGPKAQLIARAYSKKRGDARSKVFQDMDQLNSHLKEFCSRGDTILVKGSRSMKMERVVDYLMNTL